MFFDVTRGVELITCKLEWKIYDLVRHNEFMQSGKVLTSKQFHNPRCPSVSFLMRVYPSYSPIVTLSQTGIADYKDTLKIKCRIYAQDAAFEEVLITSFKLKDCKSQTEIEIDRANLYMNKIVHPDGSVLLFSEVQFVPYDIKCEDNINDLLTTNNSQNLFGHMYRQGVDTDCVIKIGDEQIDVHRRILSSNSDVFQVMFEQKSMLESKHVMKTRKRPLETLQGEINIVDSSPECVRAMIDYFYNGEIKKEILEKLAYELHAIAHKYQVKSLMDKCEQMMAIKIDPTKFALYVKYLHIYNNLPILEKACIKYIAENRRTFLTSNAWRRAEMHYKDKVNYLLKSVLRKEL